MAKKKAPFKVRSREAIQKDVNKLLRGGLAPGQDDELQKLMSELRSLRSEGEE